MLLIDDDSLPEGEVKFFCIKRINGKLAHSWTTTTEEAFEKTADKIAPLIMQDLKYALDKLPR